MIKTPHESFLFVVALMVAVALMASGCEISPSTSRDHLPVETCTKVGQRCKLGKNKLGVCDSYDGGKRAGKFFCMSQH